jgi:hypothetical protein
LLGICAVPYKFGSMSGREFLRHEYPNTFVRQQTRDPERLCIGAAGRHVEIIRMMARELIGPFAILIVLHTPRAGEMGRFESPSLSFDDVDEFLQEFGDFFESDGRSDLWIASHDDRGLIVYDRHNLIFGYGPVVDLAEILMNEGLQPGDVVVPVPHEHHYHAANDHYEERLRQYFPWRQTPLLPVDEQ